MSYKTSRRTKSILASLLIASNFLNSKINAMESQSGQNQNQNQNTYQQQEKYWWQVRGEEAVKNEENLLFEGIIVDPMSLCKMLNNTVNYCQKVYDDAKRENLKLLPCPTKEQRDNLGIGYDKIYYNKLLDLSDNKQVMGCQIFSAHLMRQLTSIFCVNTRLDQREVEGEKVSDAHISVLVPCTDGKLYVLNVYYSKNIGRYYSTIDELLTYANTEMAYDMHTKCANSNNVGLYIRVLLNQIISTYKDLYPIIVNSLTETVNKIDQEGDFQLQPYIYSDCLNCYEFKCKPEAEYQDGVSFVGCCLYLISDDDKIGDYSKYDMNIWNTAEKIQFLSKKEDWENFLKLAEAFPQSKILIAYPNAFKPKPGDTVTKLAIKGREAIKKLTPNGDGKVFQRVLSLKEFLEIESKHDSELKKLLEAKNYNFS